MWGAHGSSFPGFWQLNTESRVFIKIDCCQELSGRQNSFKPTVFCCCFFLNQLLCERTFQNLTHKKALDCSNTSVFSCLFFSRHTFRHVTAVKAKVELVIIAFRWDTLFQARCVSGVINMTQQEDTLMEWICRWYLIIAWVRSLMTHRVWERHLWMRPNCSLVFRNPNGSF